MNPILISIGNFSIRWYSILILIGIILGYLIAKKEATRFNIDSEFLFNMVFYMIIFGILGARLYYVVFNWNLYAAKPSSIFKFWEGGLAIHGGIIVGLLTMYIYCKKNNYRLEKMTDLVVPSLLLAQSIGRWGNFFNSEAYGGATTFAKLQSMHVPQFVIDGMNIGGTYYQPTFFYESIWCLLGFIILIILRRKKNIKVGFLTASYMIWYGLGRFFIEGLRTDSLMFGGIKMAQFVSFLMVIGGILWYCFLLKKQKYEDLYNDKDTGNLI